MSPSSCIHIHLPVVLNFHSQQAVFWIKTATSNEGSLLEIGVVHLGFACLCFPVSQTQICIIIVISFYGKKVKDKPPRGMCYACGLVSGCSLPRLIAVQHPPPTRRLLLHCPTLLCGLRRPRARGYISQIHKYTRSRVSASVGQVSAAEAKCCERRR